jgi:hypothetical protein
MAARKMDINDFNERLKKIGDPGNKSYYDPDMEMHVPKRVTRKPVKRETDEESLLGTMFVSVILGATAFMIAQIVRIRYFGLLEPTTTVLAIETFVTVWVLMILTVLTKKRQLFERLSQIIGIAVMMVAGHNLIWRWPEQMAVVYTPAYVEQLMATTTLHSIVFRGSVYGL